MEKMEEKVVASCRYQHPVLGTVKVKVHGAARSIRARWVGPVVQITIPRNLPVSEYDDFIARFQDRIIAARPSKHLGIGSIVDAPEVDFAFEYSSDMPARYNWAPSIIKEKPLRGKKCNYIVKINSNFLSADNASQPRAIEWLNSLLLHFAQKATEEYVIPRARELAERLHQKPLGWAVKESKTRLGCCDSRGIITLSPRLIFLPYELRDYIVWHELAHLSEMNHSQAFHEICNRYCGGREAEFEARVKTFRFPVF